MTVTYLSSRLLEYPGTILSHKLHTHVLYLNIVRDDINLPSYPMLTIYYLCIFIICSFSYFPFWFEGWIRGNDCSSS